MGPVEIITSVQHRRRWSPVEKKAIVEETEQPGMSISAVACKYGLHPNQLFKWRRLMHIDKNLLLRKLRIQKRVLYVKEIFLVRTCFLGKGV